MVCVVMAYFLMACIVMAYVVMAYRNDYMFRCNNYTTLL